MVFEVVESEALGTDESAFKVGVNDAGGLGGGGSDRNGPGPDFLLSSGEVTLQAEQGVGRTRDLVEGGFIHAKISQHFRFGFVVEFGEFTLNLRAHFDHASPGVVGVIAKGSSRRRVFSQT